MTTDWTSLALQPQLVQAVTELGYAEPTAIQSAVIPLLLAGQDVIAQAQTGTGKTAAFALPIIQTLQGGHKQVQSLILAPTRELAIQVATAFHSYGHHSAISVLAVYGGQPYERQIRRLQRGVDVVVGTPGRLLDLMRQNALDLSAVRTVVLDEADEMLSMGFIEDIETILSETPETRQTALFSATLPAEIRRLAERYLRQPQSVRIGSSHVTVDALAQRYYLVHEADKLAALSRLFEVEEISSALVFARTRAATGELASDLTARGFPAEALNGDMSQEAREQVMQRFRRGQCNVLVATDVAARGLDIDDLSHVINYDLPMDAEVYVHRVGRTGRAGKSGIALSLVTPQEQWRIRRIETFTRQPIERATLPTVEEIKQRREARLMGQLEVWLRRGRGRRERE
ncbi:MAG TPA: DEAD/DEAH box helicase, partial [Anaerolineae bacterium]|nr:DEAD/DEAH box helicase [Anaerolineae bacterium]